MNKDSQKIKKMNVDKIHYIACVDTETIGSIYCDESVLPFEIGLKIYDNFEQDQKKRVVYQKSFIVRKLFKNKYIMLSSFSASKYPMYKELIKDKKLYFVGSTKEILTRISAILKKYNIKIMMAHNGKFDKDAIERLANEFGVNNPFKNMDLLDTMQISTIITNSKKYVNFCKKNKGIENEKKESAFITNSGRVRLTAQAITCFLLDNPNYKESHTALRDIDDEINIFEASCELMGNRLVLLNTAPNWQEYEN